jgi:hypothetical protein
MSNNNKDTNYANNETNKKDNNNVIDETNLNSKTKLYKILLFVIPIIIAIIIILLGYFLRVKPDNDLIDSLKNDIEGYKKQIDTIKNSQGDINNLKAEIKTKTEQIATLTSNLNSKTNELKNYQELNNALSPLLSQIIVSSNSNNLEKINRLKEIINNIKTQIENIGLVFNLNDLATLISTNFNKLQTIKTTINANSINDINQSSLNNWFNSRINNLPENTQNSIMLRDLRSLLNSNSYTATEVINIITNIINKIRNYNETLVSSTTGTTDDEKKINQIMTNLSLYKSYYNLLIDFNNNIANLNPTIEQTITYTYPTSSTNINYNNIKSYIENSMKFLGYFSKKLSTTTNTISSLEALKTKLDEIALLVDENNSLRTELQKYQFTHIRTWVEGSTIKGSVPIDKLRNVVLTKSFDVGYGDNTTSSDMLITNNTPFFAFGDCVDNPSKCGVKISSYHATENPEYKMNILKRKNNADKLNINYNTADTQRYILLNQPDEIDWSGLSSATTANTIYNASNPNYLDLKILENSIMTNTTIDKATIDNTSSNTNYRFPNCISQIGDGVDNYQIAEIGQYGPIYENNYEVKNDTETFNDNSFSNYKAIRLTETGSSQTVNTCPADEKVIYISDGSVGTITAEGKDTGTWDNNNRISKISEDEIVGKGIKKNNIPAPIISDKMKNDFLGKNNFTFTHLDNILTIDPFPNQLKTAQLYYKCGKLVRRNIGPWCNLYKQNANMKMSLKPKSSNMVYISDPTKIDYTGL